MINEPRNPAAPSDADPRDAVLLTQPLERLQHLLAQPERYAGWLAEDHVSAAVQVFRKTLRDVRGVLGPGGIAVRDGEAS